MIFKKLVTVTPSLCHLCNKSTTKGENERQAKRGWIIDPSSRNYPCSKLAMYLGSICFESAWSFPPMPSVKKARWTQVMSIHCCCRMPYALKSNSVPAGEVTDDTVQICFIMHHGYHHNCVNLTIEKVKKYKGVLDV